MKTQAKQGATKVASGNDKDVDVLLPAADVALARELIRYAIEEIGFTIETAEQRKHMPEGLRAYAREATALLRKLT